MRAASVSNSVNGSRGTSRSRGLLSGELIDLLIEAVVLPRGPLARSAVICDLLNELCDAVDWLHGGTPPDNVKAEEAASLRQLVLAAEDHQFRMRKLRNHAFGYGGD